MKLGLPLSYSLESFVSQSDQNTASKIESVCEEAVKRGSFTPDERKALALYAQELLGIKFNVFPYQAANAACLIFVTCNTGASYEVKVTPLNREGLLRNMADSSLPGGGYNDDFIYNAKTRKFSGKGTASMCFNLFIGDGLCAKMNARELTAAFLHEVGHVWFNLRATLVFMERSIVLQETLNAVMGHDQEIIKIKGYLLKNLDKQAHRELWNKIDKGRASSADYAKASVLIKPQGTYAGSLFSEGNQRDEQAADYFTSSFGYGGDMLAFLQKLPALSPSAANKMTIITGAIGLGLLTWANPIAVPFALIGSFLLSAMTVTATKVNPYDSDDLRARRLLTHTRSLLKDVQDLDPNYVKALLKSIDRLEAAMDQYSDVMPVWNYLNPYAYRVRNGKRYEERLEALMNNPLFVSALKLKLDV